MKIKISEYDYAHRCRSVCFVDTDTAKQTYYVIKCWFCKQVIGRINFKNDFILTMHVECGECGNDFDVELIEEEE